MLSEQLTQAMRDSLAIEEGQSPLAEASATSLDEFHWTHKYFEYKPDGSLIWIKQPGRKGNKKNIGQIAGSRSKAGYVQIRFADVLWYAHQLVWLYHNGHPLPKYIDHINGDKGDNRIENLRSCTMSQNCQNSGPRKTNTSGYKGVSPSEYGWIARIGNNGKYIHLGVFNSKEEAHKAYKEEAEKLFGEFTNA